MKKALLGLIVGMMLQPVYAYARGVVKPVLSLEAVKVIYDVSRKYDIDAQALVQIAYTESKFRADAVRVNTNGTIDFGMFQINSVHWTTTCKAFDIKTLKGNAECAAKLISGIQVRHGKTDAHWLGRYHSKTPSKKVAYAKLLVASGY